MIWEYTDRTQHAVLDRGANRVISYPHLRTSTWPGNATPGRGKFRGKCYTKVRITDKLVRDIDSSTKMFGVIADWINVCSHANLNQNILWEDMYGGYSEFRMQR